jgi:carotenoid 1,2-hydratase
MSNDGQFGLTMIAFVGSVFSPYYAIARRCGSADADNFCALNVALYNRSHKRWCMTERSRRHCHRDVQRFQIGPSALRWDGTALHVDVSEVGAPVPHRITGSIRVEPTQLFKFSTPLDLRSRHRWGPIAPVARIEVNLAEPAQQWSGSAYMDSNEGDEPIENGFTSWDWSRCQLRNGSTAVLYDICHKPQGSSLLPLVFDRQGNVQRFEAPQRRELPRTAWRLRRAVHSSASVRIQEQLEDTPFYQRAILRSELLGEPVTSFHESLSIPRLVSPVVRAMLPMRMPRRF